MRVEQLIKMHRSFHAPSLLKNALNGQINASQLRGVREFLTKL